jgi:hypothetical protein
MPPVPSASTVAKAVTSFDIVVSVFRLNNLLELPLCGLAVGKRELNDAFGVAWRAFSALPVSLALPVDCSATRCNLPPAFFCRGRRHGDAQRQTIACIAGGDGNDEVNLRMLVPCACPACACASDGTPINVSKAILKAKKPAYGRVACITTNPKQSRRLSEDQAASSPIPVSKRSKTFPSW